MADNTVEYKLLLNNKQFISELSEAVNKTKGLKKNVDQTKSSFSGIGSLIGGLAIGGSIAMIGKSIFDLGVSMEQTRVSFATFTGSAEKGNQVLKELNEFANVTPFDNAQVIEASKTLLSFGVTAEELQPTLKLIGDISAGTGKDLSEMGRIFGKIKGNGRLMGEELGQLIDGGFNPLNEISKRTGLSQQELRKEMEKGNLSFEMVTQAFKDATSEGGQFANMMDKQSKTVGGRISTMVGKFQSLGIGIGEAVLPKLGEILDGFMNVFEWTMTNWSKIKNVFMPLLPIFNMLIDDLNQMRVQLGLIGSETKQLESIFNFLGNTLKILAPILKFTTGLALFPIRALVYLLTGAIKLINGFTGALIGGFTAIWNAGKSMFGNLGDLIIGVLTLDKDKIMSAVNGFTTIGKQIGVGFSNGAKEGATGLLGKDYFASDGIAGTTGKRGKATGTTGRFVERKDRTTGGLMDLATDPTKPTKPGATTKPDSKIGGGLSEVKGTKAVNLTINIGSLVERFDVTTETITGGANSVKDEIVRALLGAVNDVNTISLSQ